MSDELLITKASIQANAMLWRSEDYNLHYIADVVPADRRESVMNKVRELQIIEEQLQLQASYVEGLGMSVSNVTWHDNKVSVDVSFDKIDFKKLEALIKTGSRPSTVFEMQLEALNGTLSSLTDIAGDTYLEGDAVVYSVEGTDPDDPDTYELVFADITISYTTSYWKIRDE